VEEGGNVSEAAEHFGFPRVEIPAEVGSTREGAVRYLIGQLVQSGRLSPEHADRVASQVLHREILGSTAIGRGVALPQSKCDVVTKIVGVVGQSVQPLAWPGALDGGQVWLVVLFVVPASQPGAYLRALEEVSRCLRGDSRGAAGSPV
jgi:mannitol/fructose-specific phosphotransferase system IIA component (Ntr-type)